MLVIKNPLWHYVFGMNLRKYFFTFILFFPLTFYIFSQESLKSAEEEYYDFLSLQGISSRPYLNYRTLSDSDWNIKEEIVQTENADGSSTEKTSAMRHIWQNNYLGRRHFINGNKNLSWKIYGPDWYNSFNTAAPYGQNDGALWQGRGYNTGLSAGARFEAYGLEATLKPQISFSQNMAFDIIEPHSAYKKPAFTVKAGSYGYYGLAYIDAPQRFGNKPFFTFDWGDTEIRYTWKTLTVGFGTQNIWLGPAKLNPIIHSNNAASYPKLDLGLRRTSVYLPKLGWYLGDVEVRGWWGQLTESDWFDNDDSNNKNLIAGFSAAWAPPYLTGFSIGVNRTMLSYWSNIGTYGLFKIYNPKISGEAGSDENDQRFSLVLDYLMPKVGFELYFEWARNDFSPNLDYIIRYPFHSQAWTFGAQKAFELPKELKLQVLLELTFLETSADYDRLINWSSSFYVHHRVIQGHTNRGQWLGSGIGTGGNSQYLGFRLYHKRGSVDFFIQRQNPDLDYTMYIDSKKYPPHGKNSNFIAEVNIRALLSFGLATEYFILPQFSLTGSYIFTDERNPLNKANKDESSVHRFNHTIRLGGKYRF